MWNFCLKIKSQIFFRGLETCNFDLRINADAVGIRNDRKLVPWPQHSVPEFEKKCTYSKIQLLKMVCLYWTQILYLITKVFNEFLHSKHLPSLPKNVFCFVVLVFSYVPILVFHNHVKWPVLKVKTLKVYNKCFNL